MLDAIRLSENGLSIMEVQSTFSEITPDELGFLRQFAEVIEGRWRLMGLYADGPYMSSDGEKLLEDQEGRWRVK